MERFDWQNAKFTIFNACAFYIIIMDGFKRNLDPLQAPPTGQAGQQARRLVLACWLGQRLAGWPACLPAGLPAASWPARLRKSRWVKVPSLLAVWPALAGLPVGQPASCLWASGLAGQLASSVPAAGLPPPGPVHSNPVQFLFHFGFEIWSDASSLGPG